MGTNPIWLQTQNEEGKDIHFSVPSSWLLEVMNVWATEDAQTVERDKETYISGRKQHLYEMAVNGEMESYTIESIYSIARKAGVIVEEKKVSPVKDFSIREEIKVVSEQAGLKLSEEDIDTLVDEVQENEDLLSIVSFFVKREVKNFALNKGMSFEGSELDPMKEVIHLQEFNLN